MEQGRQITLGRIQEILDYFESNVKKPYTLEDVDSVVKGLRKISSMVVENGVRLRQYHHGRGLVLEYEGLPRRLEENPSAVMLDLENLELVLRQTALSIKQGNFFKSVL